MSFRMYQGKYYQGSLDDTQAEAILSLTSEYSSVQSLRHVIKDAPEYLIMDMIKEAEEYENQHGSLEGYSFSNPQAIGTGTLRDNQTVGVAFLYYAGSALLGDEVGMGKTVQIAGLHNVLESDFANKGKDFKMLFLGEKSSAGQVRNKLIQFTGKYVGLIESGEAKSVKEYIRKNENKKYYSVVGSHSLLQSPEFLTYVAKNPFDLIVIDESSILKNASNTYYVSCAELFKFHQRIVLLNATPLETNVRDIYNQLKLLDKDYMPTVGEFEKMYVVKKKTMYGYMPKGFKNEDKFREAIKLRYFAQTRSDLGANYRDNLYETFLVPLSPVQKELSKKTSLHQMVVDFPSGVDYSVQFDIHTTPKLKLLLELVDNTVEKGMSQAVVYCRFLDAQAGIQEELEHKGYRVVVLNGTSTTKKREEMVRDFNNGKYDVMLTNVLKGIDLKTCDTAIMYTIDPNPQKMVQFEGRITREFNIENKKVYLLVAMGREKKFVEDKLKMRVDASKSLTKTGRSMVLEAISTGDNRTIYDNMDTLDI